ncbi:MAG: carboxypeptidase-like regulatory domain-containing protein [Bacteroidota bacterium]|nr:carboxypeptidase-like regulatory domain-containing protein [Bacteroidota bacterium]MDP4231262.1 carboxypeptidase-like regulatory domain-containing protein [Bacteroidota bacterium]
MKLHAILSFALLALVYGCKSSTTNAPQDVTGDLKGTVGLVDSHGNQVADKSGVLVTAEGTTLSATSDADGNWIIHNLPTQTYTIAFSKAGYGTKKNTSFSFVGGGTVAFGDRMTLYQPLGFTVTLDSATPPEKPVYDASGTLLSKSGVLYGHISGATLADSNLIKCLVFMGTSSTIDTQDTSSYVAGFSLADNGYFHFLTRSGSDLKFMLATWQDCGPKGWMKSGMKIYMQALATTSFYTGAPYFDIQTGKYIYSDPIPASNVLSVDVP